VGDVNEKPEGWVKLMAVRSFIGLIAQNLRRIDAVTVGIRRIKREMDKTQSIILKKVQPFVAF
jgi:hypothetical protein